MSARKAASQAGLSDARWRQIVSGYQSVSGAHVPVRAPAETLARMAQVVGVSPEQLAEAGREDAAQELGKTRKPSKASGSYANDPTIDAIATLLATLPPEAQDEVLRRVGRGEPNRSTDRTHGHERQAG
ncbi:hypothetical protein [Streptomyces sp. ISL-86]|uniref:hypothetical protein n=1 Tax=Streptomyces sp. ISL-86 TaxID=2819187 RepID=UPI001BE7B721|nr:hypothetical protein [Streptomyces sp. ISL-86]MBT2453334.1 hypothetical protein [Streptomyces sp. ISL-86]